MTKRGTKKSTAGVRRRANIPVTNPVYNPYSLKQLATLAMPEKSDKPRLTYQNIPKTGNRNIPQPSIKVSPEIMNEINPAELLDIPPELMQQLFAN